MTTDDERFRAIENARWFLRRLLTEMPFPYNKTEMRHWARRLLKHYPEEYFIEDLKKQYFDGTK